MEQEEGYMSQGSRTASQRKQGDCIPRRVAAGIVYPPVSQRDEAFTGESRGNLTR